MHLTERATLPVPVGTAKDPASSLNTDAGRAPRCQVLDISAKHGANRCTSEATNPGDAVLLCLSHRIKIITDLARLPGVEIVITAQPTP